MKKRNILFGLLAFVLVFIGTFVSWAGDARQAKTPALTAMQGSAAASVTTDKWIIFTPTNATPTVGFIFYPGGKVEAEAYAPVLLTLAESGYLVVNVPMPLNLAVFGVDKAADVIADYPQIKVWVIGGHSLGGSMAASYAFNNPDDVAGLILWGSYPPDSNNFSASDLIVLSVYGSEDGDTDGIEAAASLLPATTIWARIEGGNHAQFGNYGEQEGDGQATISITEQQKQIIESTLVYLHLFTK